MKTSNEYINLVTKELITKSIIGIKKQIKYREHSSKKHAYEVHNGPEKISDCLDPP
jgi:hypothetical protein